jgi:hypothetical protein
MPRELHSHILLSVNPILHDQQHRQHSTLQTPIADTDLSLVYKRSWTRYHPDDSGVQVSPTNDGLSVDKSFKTNWPTSEAPPWWCQRVQDLTHSWYQFLLMWVQWCMQRMDQITTLAWHNFFS